MSQRPKARFTRRTALRAAFGAAAIGLMGACVPIYRHHGYVPTDEDLAMVVVGQTHETELASLIGQPSTHGLLSGSGWFYVGSRFRHFGALQPREVERTVVAITFDQQGRVANVERFGLEQGRIVVLSRRVTDPGVSGLSALRQLLGNLGNVTAGQIFN